MGKDAGLSWIFLFLSLFLLFISAIPASSALIEENLTVGNESVLYLEMQHDFSISLSRTSLVVCRHASSSFFFTIKNLGDSSATYNFELSGTAAPYSLPSMRSVFLLPGEEKKVSVFVKASSSFPDFATLGIKVSSPLSSKYFEVKMEARDCSSLVISDYSDFKSTCPCSPSSAYIKISNPSPFTENYRLSSDFKYVSFSTSSFFLLPHTFKLISVFVKSPCSSYGLKEVPIKIEALTSGSEIVLKQKYNIKRCYGYSVWTSSYKEENGNLSSDLKQTTHYHLCLDKNYAIPLAIFNNASFENSYSIKLDGPRWMRLYKPSIDVPPGEIKVIDIFAGPKEGYENVMYKNYNASIRVRSSLGDYNRNLTISLSLSKCFDLSMSITPYDTSLAEDVVCCMPEKRVLKIRNKGIDVNISLNASVPWIRLPGRVNVPANSSVNIPMLISPNCSVLPRRGVVIISAKVSGFNVKKIFRLQYPVALRRGKECSMPSVSEVGLIKNRNIRVHYFNESHGLVVVNKGERISTYLITPEGESWMRVYPQELTLHKGEKGYLTLVTNPTNQTASGVYPLILHMYEPSIDMTFDIPVSVTLFKWTFMDTLGYLTYFCWKGLIAFSIIIILIVLLLFGIFSLKGRKKGRRRNSLMKSYLSLLILMFLLLAIVLYSLLSCAHFNWNAASQTISHVCSTLKDALWSSILFVYHQLSYILSRTAATHAVGNVSLNKSINVSINATLNQTINKTWNKTAGKNITVIVTACSDGVDNDGDGLIDMLDPGCSSPLDQDEHNYTEQCDDGMDNDNDSLIDARDPGCRRYYFTGALMRYFELYNHSGENIVMNESFRFRVLYSNESELVNLSGHVYDPDRDIIRIYPVAPANLNVSVEGLDAFVSVKDTSRLPSVYDMYFIAADTKGAFTNSKNFTFVALPIRRAMVNQTNGTTTSLSENYSSLLNNPLVRTLVLSFFTLLLVALILFELFYPSSAEKKK